jgi:hypothetical protein
MGNRLADCRAARRAVRTFSKLRSDDSLFAALFARPPGRLRRHSLPRQRLVERKVSSAKRFSDLRKLIPAG